MKIRVVSDLHLEFSDYAVPTDPSVDVLILSGDILIAQDLHDHPAPDPYVPGGMDSFMRRLETVKRFRGFLKRCSESFSHVFYVAGNHEFYHGKWVKSLDYLREECAQYPNVHFLEKNSVDIDDVTFIGGTLWTDMNRGDPLTLHTVQTMMNDYRLIRHDTLGYRKLKAADTVIRHRETLAYIKQTVEQRPDRKHVVVGHHSPSYRSIHESYASERELNGAYHSDLSEFILDHPQIKLWTHGHTHHAYNYMIGETRIVCNPRGYQNDGYHEDTGWNPQISIEV